MFIEKDFIDSYARLCGWNGIEVYIALCRYANKERCCFPSIELLSKLLGISENSVKRGIKALVKWGIIKVEKGKWKNGKWKNNFYCLQDRSKWQQIPETPENFGKEYNHSSVVNHQENPEPPQSFEEKKHSSDVTHPIQSPEVTHRNTDQSHNHSSMTTSPDTPERPDHSSEVPTKNIYKEELEIKDTLILQRIEIIKRYGFKDIDTRIIPYTQDGAHNLSTPSEIMKSFIKSFKAKDEKYLNLLGQLKSKGIPAEIAETELAKFYNYWTELNQVGTKQKWEMEKCFEVSKRLANWFSNYQKFRPKEEEKRGIKIS